MSLWVMLGIAAGLAMDALAVSVAAGIYLTRVTPRHVFRLAFHFGLFQALMPILGWFLGTTFAAYIVAWDHFVVFGLLGFIGGRMIYEGYKGETIALGRDPSRGGILLSLAFATSIDALAVGLSFAMLNEQIYLPALIIGVVTGILSAVGVLFGTRIGLARRRGAVMLGGLVLVAIGVKVLVSHLFGF